jgi:hypothetical protein
MDRQFHLAGCCEPAMKPTYTTPKPEKAATIFGGLTGQTTNFVWGPWL